MIDSYRIRQDTPPCRNILFLNSAGSSLMPRQVLNKMSEYQSLEGEVGGYAAAAMEQHAISGFYIACAELLNTKKENIAFVYNATDGYSKAVSSIPFNSGDYILLTDNDYISNHFLFISLSKRLSINIIRCNNLESGDLDLNDMELKIKKYKPKLVSVTHIPTNSGKIQPIEEVGVLCKKYDVWYIVDACQSVGQLPVDVQKIKCDFLSATGRKFLRGPRGTGLLYISDKALDFGLAPLLIDMEGAVWKDEDQFTVVQNAKRFELWESNYVNIIGLKEAILYAQSIGLRNIEQHNSLLVNELKYGLYLNKELILTENGSYSAGIVTFTSKKHSLDQTKSLLNQHKVSYSIGFRHFALIDFNKKDVDWVIRFSPHYFNTIDEINKVVEILDDL